MQGLPGQRLGRTRVGHDLADERPAERTLHIGNVLDRIAFIAGKGRSPCGPHRRTRLELHFRGRIPIARLSGEGHLRPRGYHVVGLGIGEHHAAVFPAARDDDFRAKQCLVFRVVLNGDGIMDVSAAGNRVAALHDAEGHGFGRDPTRCRAARRTIRAFGRRCRRFGGLRIGYRAFLGRGRTPIRFRTAGVRSDLRIEGISAAREGRKRHAHGKHDEHNELRSGFLFCRLRARTPAIATETLLGGRIPIRIRSSRGRRRCTLRPKRGNRRRMGIPTRRASRRRPCTLPLAANVGNGWILAARYRKAEILQKRCDRLVPATRFEGARPPDNTMQSGLALGQIGKRSLEAVGIRPDSREQVTGKPAE